ncbi:hypothetical protein V1478_005207 [Vespula squamosa]|uniref:Uncharacterized protein n=1 Tax=Vespula squamosa TaxID=30214 RepID=A0ABD2BDH2_VESSQ
MEYYIIKIEYNNNNKIIENIFTKLFPKRIAVKLITKIHPTMWNNGTKLNWKMSECNEDIGIIIKDD